MEHWCPPPTADGRAALCLLDGHVQEAIGVSEGVHESDLQFRPGVHGYAEGGRKRNRTLS